MARKRAYKSRKQAAPSEAVFIVTLIVACVIGLVAFQASPEVRYLIILCAAVLALVVAATVVFISYEKRNREVELARALAIAHIDTMKGEEFERYMAHVFRYRGYRVQDTPRSGDFGVDLLITKDGERTAVQLKRYSKSIDQAAVREVVAGRVMKNYKATHTMVVTNSHFTKSARELAKAHGCTLVDRELLAVWIDAFQKGTSR